MGTTEFIFEGSSYFLICAYFYWVSKYWQYVLIPVVGLALIGSIPIMFIPESPRLLVTLKKYD